MFSATSTIRFLRLALALCLASGAAGCNDEPRARVYDPPLPRDATPVDAAADDAAASDATLPLSDAVPSPDEGPWPSDAEADAAPDAAPADAAPRPDAEPPPEGIRLAMQVSNDVAESIWVQLNGLDGQTAWVVITGPQGRVWLDERCGVPDCDDDTGACGVAEPMVRDVTGGTYQGTIERLWSGLTSVETSAGCELREPSAPGAYEARFCWSLRADLEGTGNTGDPTVAVPGTLVDPACATVGFELPADDEVLFRILGG